MVSAGWRGQVFLARHFHDKYDAIALYLAGSLLEKRGDSRAMFVRAALRSHTERAECAEAQQPAGSII